MPGVTAGIKKTTAVKTKCTNTLQLIAPFFFRHYTTSWCASVCGAEKNRNNKVVDGGAFSQIQVFKLKAHEMRIDVSTLLNGEIGGEIKMLNYRFYGTQT